MKRIHISLFKNVWDKNPTIINLYEYLTKHIGTNLNGAQQLRYRQLLDEGRKEEAQEVKKSQECAVFGGVCAGGRGEKCLTSISGAAGFDLDHVGGRLAEIKGMLQLPFVYAVYTTFSGEGLRVVVNMGTDKAEEMRSRYLLVARFLSRLCNHPCDMQCKDIARASFTSFDPDIWINPDEVEPFPLPAGYGQDAPQETAAPAKEQPEEQAGEGMPDGTEERGTPAGEEPGMIEGVCRISHARTTAEKDTATASSWDWEAMRTTATSRHPSSTS